MSDQNIFKPLWCYTYQYSPYKRVHPDSFLLLTLKYVLQHLFHCVRLFNICFSVPLQSKPRGLKEMKAPFLYGILVKRLELSAAMFTPSRLLLRLGNKMQSKLKKSLPRKVLFVCSEVMPYLASITSRCSGKERRPDTRERRKSSLCLIQWVCYGETFVSADSQYSWTPL